MRGSKLQKARAERRDKWFEKEYDVPKYPIMERDRKKLNFDQGREIHNWDDLAALSRTGRPEDFKAKKKKSNKDENFNGENKIRRTFAKPSQTVRLSKSFDKTSLRCEVRDIEGSDIDSACILVLAINGVDKKTIERTTNGNFSKIVSCYIEGKMKVLSLQDVNNETTYKKIEQVTASCRLSLSLSPCDAKRVLSLYGKRVVKKVIAGCVVGISAIECIGENEAKARGLMNSSSGKRNNYTNIDATQIDLKKEDTLRFTLGGSKSRKNSRHGTKETISVAQQSPQLHKHYRASHLEQALAIIGGDILQVNDVYEKAYQRNKMKNKEDEPVISFREATEAICRLLKNVPPGAGDIVRHFMEDQEDKRYINYSDFVKLFAFGFHHLMQQQKNKGGDSGSWTMVDLEADDSDDDIIILDKPTSKEYVSGDTVTIVDDDVYETTMETVEVKPRKKFNKK